jgi:16S rRNA (guanine527-N7)-methyltransferase
MIEYGADAFLKDTDVSRETLARLEGYVGLLIKWQKAKNLVADSTLSDAWRRHFLDSAQMFPLIQKHVGSRPISFLDIGSGAGFPGLVLSIMGLGNANMVESNGRKCVFMNQVVRETKADATIHNERIENLDTFPVDIIVSRACAKVSQLLEWSERFVGSATELWLLKGEGAEEELTQAKASWSMQSERFPSVSSSTGVILRLSQIKRL